MATQKPLSTISYNSESFLREKLDIWIQGHIIQAYQYICHKGEDGDKDHIHVRIEPNKKLDPMNLTEALKEFVPGEAKPRTVRPWRPSKEEDWILYAVHDKQYLSLKYNGGEKGEKLPYSWEKIVVNDGYDMEIAFIRAKSYLEHTSQNLAVKLSQGTNPLELVLQGENVYTVNAIARTLYNNDYQRLASDYDKLCHELNLIKKAIEDSGHFLSFDSDGNYTLERYDDTVPFQ